jgi:hypothetical protein
MTTRILITDPSGFPLAALDGHHGARHAVDWLRDMREILARNGITETMVFEITPQAGGDDYRRQFMERLGRIRFNFHRRPDGKREIVGALVAPDGSKRGAASLPADARITVHIVDAPESIHGARRPIRIPRGRQNGTGPRTDAEKRIARRLDRANSRGNP